MRFVSESDSESDSEMSANVPRRTENNKRMTVMVKPQEGSRAQSGFNMAALDVSNSTASKKRRGCYLSYLSNPLEKVPRQSRLRVEQTLRDISSCCYPEKATVTRPIVDSNCDLDLTSSVDISIDQMESSDQSDLEEFLLSGEKEGDQQKQTSEESLMDATGNRDVYTADPAKFSSDGIRTDNSDVDIGIADLHDLLSQTFPEDPALNDAIGSDQLLDGIELDEKSDGEEEEESVDSFTKITELSAKHDVPLYAGSPITFSISMLLIVTFAMRHSLTGIALADLLTLINVHLVIPNCFAKSTSVLNRFFRQLKQPIEYHYYCTFCYEYIGLKKTTCCTNKHCLSDFSKKGAVAYFIVLPLVTQLQSLMARLEVQDLLQYPVTRKKQKADNIEDIFDGQLYKRHFGDDGFMRGTSAEQKKDEVHLSLQINTDGVAVFKSSKFSIWPVYFIINELPPNCRKQRKYRMFAGLWFGVSKPHFQTFMKPFADTINELFHKGCTIKVKEDDKTLRCILLLGTFDAPAKCLFQEFSQFNAFYGCPYCLSPGETVRTSSKGHTHAYPFTFDECTTGHGEPRTHEQTLKFGTEAANQTAQDGNQHTVKGVKGLSWFMFLPKFDVIRGVAIDYMHSTLLGVMKMLLTLWCDKAYKAEPWSINSRMKDVDDRFMKINPPSSITRLPRSLSANFSHLKASELRTFLLFYSIPCLYGILQEQYFQHYILLVEAIYLLLQDSISLDDLRKATALLKHFCIRMKELYAARYETFNVHCLLHLTERVFDLGPLWTHSCFCFEDFNGELRSLFHGTQSIEEQIVLAVRIQQKIPELVPLLPDGSVFKEFYNHLSRKMQFNACKKEELFSGGCFSIVGNLKKHVLTTVERVVLELLTGPVAEVFQFKRLRLGAQMIHSKAYKCMTRRNNYTIRFKRRNESLDSFSFGEILFYVKCFVQCPIASFCSDSCKCRTAKCFAIVEVLEQNMDIVIANDPYTGAVVPHLFPVVRRENALIAVPVESIVGICFHINCGNENTSFLGIFPNQYEKD